MTDMLNEFVEGIKAAYGQRIVSIVLFGSRAAGGAAGDKSDFNLLVILDAVSFRDITAIPQIKKWVKAGNPPPLIFSQEMFLNSADVFPIEFLDMRESHKILYGHDVLAKLKFSNRNLRHQCEFELKGKLLKLRQSYMVCRGSYPQVKELLTGSISSIIVVFRHVLQLYDEVPPADKIDVLPALARHTGITPDVFIAVARMKQGDRDVRKLDPDAVMEEYITQIEKVVVAVDTMAY